MNARWMILLVALGTVGLGFWSNRPAGGETWEGSKLTPVPRQEVFEFTQPPTFRQATDAAGKPIRDRYEIAFASKAACDVAVAIHDAQGALIRHLVYGVLGSNAPAPLAPNNLAQKIVWDAKDDFGNYVPDPSVCKVRVSLGLKPTFDKIIGWHPKDACGGYVRFCGLGAGPNGVYAMTTLGYWRTLRVFNHDGSYQRTLIPFPADKWPTMKGGLTRQPVCAVGEPGRGEAGGATWDVPARGAGGEFHPFNFEVLSMKMALANGYIVWPQGEYGIQSGLYRIKEDGGADLPILGPPITSERDSRGMGNVYAIAASPDGKWMYVTRLITGSISLEGVLSITSPGNMPNRRHAVFRLPWDGKEPVGTESFVGEVTAGNTNKGASSENDHLNNPEDITTDPSGRVYVADCGNNRIQVFSPEGKYLHTIPVETPHKVGVHHRTGEVYVMSYPWGSGPATLYKFSAVPEGRLLAKTEVVIPGRGLAMRDNQNRPVFSSSCFALDSWTEPAQVWIAVHYQMLRFADRGDKFEFLEDFDETIRQDGYTPHAYNGKSGQQITADRIRGHVYLPGLKRCDPEVGKAWEFLRSPLSRLDNFQVGYDGYIYLRHIKGVARVDPSILSPAGENKLLSGEVPFDYGEEVTNGQDGMEVSVPAGQERKLTGVLRLPAQVPGNGFNMGFAVNHLGHVAALCVNYQKAQEGFHKGMAGFAWSDLPDFRYRPPNFPGRLWQSGQVVFVYDAKGQCIGEDVVQSLNGRSAGIKLDGQDNVYVGLAAFKIIDGKPQVSACGGGNGPGVVCKFPLSGGRIYGDWGEPLKLDATPDRPHDFVAGYGHLALDGRGARLWTKNMLWSYCGQGTLRNCDACICPQSRFDIDVYGRVFVPESWRFSVGVVDTNGNPVMHIGRYGNADSGRGPDSPIPVPGDIAFSNCDYLCTVSDKWLYVHDTGNWRVVRIKLGYNVENVVPLR